MVKSVLLVVVLAAPVAAVAQDGLVTIPREQAECLSGIPNVEKLIRTDPVLLRLETCPDIIAGARDLLESSQNTSPGILTPRTGNGVEILIMTRRELVCMIDHIKMTIDAAPDLTPVNIDMSQCAGD